MARLNEEIYLISPKTQEITPQTEEITDRFGGKPKTFLLLCGEFCESREHQMEDTSREASAKTWKYKMRLLVLGLSRSHCFDDVQQVV